MGLAKGEEPEHVIEIAVGEDDGPDGGVAGRAGMQALEAFDLLPDLGGAVEEEPARSVGAHRHRLLGAGRRLQRAVTEAATVGASAIPLREAASGGGAQDTDAHDGSPGDATAPGLGEAPRGG